MKKYRYSRNFVRQETFGNMEYDGWIGDKPFYFTSKVINSLDNVLLATVEPKKECKDHRSKYGEAECLCCGKSFIEHGDKIVGSESSESLVGKTSPQSTPPTPKKPIHSLPEKIECPRGTEEYLPRFVIVDTINSIIDWLQAEKEK